jgi:hypothetical protein
LGVSGNPRNVPEVDTLSRPNKVFRPMLERIGEHVVQGRALFVLEVQRPEELRALPELPSSHFACLVAWDADTADEVTIAQVADALIQAGAVYVCAWGRECERVHDIIDLALAGTARSSEAVPPVITTSHSEESLADAL